MRASLAAALVCALAAPAAAGPAPRGGVAIGAEMVVGDTTSGPGGPTVGFAGWAGWLVTPHLAALGWAQFRFDGGTDNGVISLGLAPRVWVPRAGRLYGELRGGFTEMGLAHIECDPTCPADRTLGAIVGLAGGVELLHNRFTAVDARAELTYTVYGDKFWNGFQGMLGLAITLFPGPHPSR